MDFLLRVTILVVADQASQGLHFGSCSVGLLTVAVGEGRSRLIQTCLFRLVAVTDGIAGALEAPFRDWRERHLRDEVRAQSFCCSTGECPIGEQKTCSSQAGALLGSGLEQCECRWNIRCPWSDSVACWLL
jgi:hypothetical protein